MKTKIHTIITGLLLITLLTSNCKKENEEIVIDNGLPEE